MNIFSGLVIDLGGMSTCVECNIITTKYRCPNCLERYCSLACCKAHKEKCVKVNSDSTVNESTHTPEVKENGSLSRKKESLTQNQTADGGSDDTVPDELLQQLECSTELKEALCNPHLRAIMENLINTDNPDQAIAEAMHEPIFTELTDICLRIVDPNNPKC